MLRFQIFDLAALFNKDYIIRNPDKSLKTFSVPHIFFNAAAIKYLKNDCC
jgi:hypothetical protein